MFFAFNAFEMFFVLFLKALSRVRFFAFGYICVFVLMFGRVFVLVVLRARGCATFGSRGCCAITYFNILSISIRRFRFYILGCVCMSFIALGYVSVLHLASLISHENRGATGHTFYVFLFHFDASGLCVLIIMHA